MHKTDSKNPIAPFIGYDPLNYKDLSIRQMFSQSKSDCEKALSTPIKQPQEICIYLEALNELKNESQNRYKNFCIANNTLTFKISQKFFNKLSERIAIFISYIFPFNLLFNYVQDVKSTKIEYYSYQLFIENKINYLQKRQGAILEICECNEKINRLLSDSKDNGPAKLQCFKEVVRNLIYSINQLDSQFDKSAWLLEIGLDEYLTETLLNGPKELLAQGKEETFRFFIEQLASDEYAQSLFKPYQEVLQFDVDQRGGLQLLKSVEGQRPVRQRPNCFDTYQGLIEINIRDVANLKSLTELREILATHPNCQPGLTISWKHDQKLTQEILQLLSEIKSYISYIQIKGLQELDLTSLQEEQFFSLLPFLDFSQTNLKLSLSNRMENWSDKQLYALKKLPVNSLDLQQISSENLKRILSTFPSVPHLSINQPDLTDKDFKEMMTQYDLQQLASLNLTGCNQLTTDSLVDLVTISSLQELIYPSDMQLGNPLLLPALSNPFDIKRFYLSASAIRPLINQLYDGSLLFAPIFQIPLVRQGGECVFSEKQTYLAPSSVTYWLYKEDYQNLTPQLTIKSLFADNCPYLNDQNLSNFLQKFPATTELSLCNCPGITDAGVIHMLEQNPQIVKLDLTSCPGITERLFAEENHEILSNLESIIIADTQLTLEQIEKLPKALRQKTIEEKNRAILSDLESIIFSNIQLTIEHIKEQLETLRKKIIREENRAILPDLESIISDTQLTVEQTKELLELLRKKIIFEEKSLKITEKELQAAGSLEIALNNHLPLNKLIHLDLSDCVSLRKVDFEHLIGRFDLPLEIEQRINPYRFNISTLNLKGATYSRDWFRGANLGNLQRILVDEPKAASLQKQHPDIHFQHTYAPIVQAINMDKHLSECANFLHIAENSIEKQLRAKEYLHHRALVELFGENCMDKNLVKDVLSYRIRDINQEEFRDLELTFIDNLDNLSASYLFKEEAYCQSISLRNELRPGGLFFKSTFPMCNSNASPAANRLIAQLIQGQPLLIAKTDWKAIAEAAELANPHNLNMPAFYKQLMNGLYQKIQNMPVSYLTDGQANDMLNKVIALANEKAQALLEQRLLSLSVSSPESYEEVQIISSNLPNLDLGMSLVKSLLELYIVDTRDPEIPEIIDAELFDQLLAKRNKETIFEILTSFPLAQQKYLLGHLIRCLMQQMQNEVEALELKQDV